MGNGFIQKIKKRITLVECVTHYWGNPQRRLGEGLWWRCELHGENTPSFRVFDNRFHCFGCHEFGDVFDFIRKIFMIEQDIDIAKKLNYDFNLGMSFDKRNESREERTWRIKRSEECEKEKIKEKNLEKFTKNTVCEIIQQLRFYESVVMEYENKPLEWHYKNDTISSLTVYAHSEIDRLEYLYSLVNSLPVNFKSYWHNYYGENRIEILRKIYKEEIRIYG